MDGLFNQVPVDPFGAYAQGAEARRAVQGQNALAQYAGAAMQGDPNALAMIAQFDPMLAFQLSSGLKQDARADKSLQLQERGFEADQAHRDRQFGLQERGFEADQAYRAEQLALARQEGQRAIETHAVNMDAATREATIGDLTLGISALEAAIPMGPEAVQAVMAEWGDQLPENLRSLPPEQLVEFGRGMLDGLAGPVDPVKVGAGETLVNPRTMEPMFTGPADTSKTRQAEGDLRVEFNKLTSDFRTVHDAQRRIAATTGDTAAADMSLIFQYMKMLDPGSTVREGEYASAEATRGLPDTVVALYNKALRGERLTPGQREEFRRTARALYDGAKSDYDKNAERYRDLSAEYGLDAGNVILGYGADMPAAAPPPPSGQAGAQPGTPENPIVVDTVQQANELPSGTHFKDPNGNIRVKP